LSFDDDITSILSDNEDELRKYFKLDRMFPPRESVMVADSKNRALEFAKNLGIPTPEFFIPKDELELAEICKKINYPVVVKGEKGAGAWKVRNANDFD
jgi:biotin carboxylase